MAVTALFYQYLEVNLKSPYTGGARSLAWLHLILSNLGIVGATVLIIYAGYVTGVATLPTSVGGLGMAMSDVEATVLTQYLFPIAAFATLTILGIALGGLGYVIVYKQRPKAQF